MIRLAIAASGSLRYTVPPNPDLVQGGHGWAEGGDAESRSAGAPERSVASLRWPPSPRMSNSAPAAYRLYSSNS